MDRAGVSSIIRFELKSTLIFSISCIHSDSFSLPLAIFSAEIPDSIAKSLCTSWVADISKEKKATFLLKVRAALRAMESTKDVLPIPGRAAMMIRSERCQPPIFSSMARMPVRTCNSSLLLLFISCNSWMAFCTTVRSSLLSRSKLFWIMLNRSVSALSISSNTSLESS